MTRRGALRQLAGVALGLSIAPGPSIAGPDIPLAYRNLGRALDVPPRLLYAVALQESRLALGQALVRPWPWTLNAAGTPLRFKTHRATYEALRARLDADQTNVDIGLMQVNWGYHAHRFETIDEAVDPYRNIRVGALILREEYERRGDWWEAVGHYHSYRPRTADAYSESVRRLWSALPERSSG